MNLKTEKPTLPFTPCRYLRTKRMYIPVLAEGALEDYQPENDQSFYWCNKTLGPMGHDDFPVHPCSCQPGRSCHQT